MIYSPECQGFDPRKSLTLNISTTAKNTGSWFKLTSRLFLATQLTMSSDPNGSGGFRGGAGGRPPPWLGKWPKVGPFGPFRVNNSYVIL